MADLSIDFCGIKSPNPFWLASAPPANSGPQIMRAFDAGWGETRTLEVEPVSDTGFHLGGALYFGYKGRRHGQWKGSPYLEGERYADTSTREAVEEIHQLRDCVIRVREGDAVGYATFESMVIGEHPRYGLTKESSIL